MDAIQSMSSNMSEITPLFTFHNLFVRRSKLKLTWCLATYRYTCPNQEITGAETGAGRKRLIRGWMKVKRPAKEKRKKMCMHLTIQPEQLETYQMVLRLFFKDTNTALC